MTLNNEEIHLLRLLCDIAIDLPDPEGEQVEKLLAKVELFILSTNLKHAYEQPGNV